MIILKNGIETKVQILPYEESTIQRGQFLQTGRTPIEITSVKDYENDLICISLPGGEKVVACASQIICAIQKCIL